MQTFTKENTNQAKGIAIILMLFHHLFYYPCDIESKIYFRNIELINWIALNGKVCVGIFVLLSGYGLYASQSNRVGLKSFYLKNYSKLYLNYWLMWLLFVPVGIIVFGRTFNIVYHNYVFVKSFIDFIGLIDFFSFGGYNSTWWFMSCILELYFIYPFLKVLVSKFDSFFVIIVFLASLFSYNISFAGMQPYEPIRDYLFTFVLGIYLAKQNVFIRMNEIKLNRMIKLTLLVVLLCSFVFIRSYLRTKALIVTDGLIAIAIIQMIVQLNLKLRLLAFFGKHSFNIFLFHTFICSYFFKQYILWFKYPILILTVFLSVCLFLSVGIEYLKRVVGFNQIQPVINKCTFKNDIYFD